jgi:tRNA (guanine-N7-)-methyltransferase
VFTDEFAAQCQRILRPGGRLLVATDVEDYAALVRQTVAGRTRLRELPPPGEKAPGHDMDYLTNYERKFRRQGKPIWRLEYEKD